MNPAEIQSLLTERTGVRWSDDRLRDLDSFLARGLDLNDHNVLVEFMNGETYFFRYPRYLAALQSMLDRHREDRPFRVLSAACSSGEETYSVVFALLDRAEAAGVRVEVVGSDVRPRAVAMARRGVYSHWSFRNLSTEDRARYFDEADQTTWRVKDRYRSIPRFIVRNLLDPVEDAPYDAVLVCNATLYMEPRAARRVYERMAMCLRPEGLLLLAPTDPAPGHEWTRAGEHSGGSAFRRLAVDAKPTFPAPHRDPMTPVVPAVAAAKPVRAGSSPPRPTDPVWLAWTNGSLPSVQDELRRRIFLEPDGPLWRFLNGVLLWEQGWLKRAHLEIERSRDRLAKLPNAAAIAGLCTAGELRRMIEVWKGERARH